MCIIKGCKTKEAIICKSCLEKTLEKSIYYCPTCFSYYIDIWYPSIYIGDKTVYHELKIKECEKCKRNIMNIIKKIFNKLKKKRNLTEKERNFLKYKKQADKYNLKKNIK